MEEQEFSPLVRAVGVIDENRNFIPYGSTMVAKGLPLFFFKTKEEYDQHAPTLPEPCAVITLDDIDTGGFEFDDAIDPESENAVQNKVIAAALEALRDKANFDRPGMVRFTDSPTVTDRNSGFGLSAIEKNASVEGTLANNIIKSTINTHFIRIEANCSGTNDNVYVSDALYEIPDVVLNGYITSIVERAWPLDTWRNANVSILQTQIEQNKLRVAVCSKENARYEIAIRVLYFSG